MPLQVFVYGTLKPGEANYQYYCAGKLLSEVPAYTKGRLFALPAGYPALTVGDDRVEGFLLSFIKEDALAALDQLEGYHEGYYNRQKQSIYDLQHNLLGEAWLYLMTFSQIKALGGTLVLSGSWHGSVNYLCSN